MSLADDLQSEMAFEVRVCKVCSLIKTLPKKDAETLEEAYTVGVSAKKIYDALQKNGYIVGRDRVLEHRNVCLAEEA